jgi:predicted MFS family arabinose efflux permease
MINVLIIDVYVKDRMATTAQRIGLIHFSSQKPIMSTVTGTSRPNRSAIWPYIFAGLCASLVGIGLARFAYTPLIPPLIQAHWFSASDVVYLGAANLAGYLIGALLGRAIAARLSNVRTLRWGMVFVTAAFLACAFPISAIWFFCWRLISGIAGGAIMVLVAATVLPHVPGARKGLAGGAIFLGLGLGIAGSGTLVPLLLQMGLRETWIGLGLVSALLTAASWFAWPSSPLAASSPATLKVQDSVHSQSGAPLNLLYVEYALMASSLIPAMVFLVDFIVRGLGASARFGAFFWILYGVGAIIGPPLYGFLADRMGPRIALRFVMLIEAIAVACLYTAGNFIFIGFITIIIGTFPSGLVPLVLARVHELVPHNPHRQNIVWSRATTLSAAAMALAGYGYSALFNATGGDHRMLFLVAGASVALALIADIGMLLWSGREAHGSALARSR